MKFHPRVNVVPAIIAVAVLVPLMSQSSLRGVLTVAIPTFVQQASTTPQGSQPTVSVTYSHAQNAGDTNVVAVGWNDTTSTVASVTDSAGNTYQVAAPTARGTALSQTIYYAKTIHAAAAGANTVNVTFNQAAAIVDLRALEYRGLDPSNPMDVQHSAAGSGTNANSGAATTTSSTELLVGAGMTTGYFSGAGTGFTQRVITAPDADIAEDGIASTAGSYSASAPENSASWVMEMVVFRSAGTAPTPTPTPSPTPVSLRGVPCTVTLNGAQQKGTCTGTFTATGSSPTPTPSSTSTPSPTPTHTPSPSPPPTPTPTGNQSNCIAKPSACGYPDGTNSGVPLGTPLVSKSGTITASAAGQVVSGINLTNGEIDVTANNVTIKDSVITTGNGTMGSNWAIYIAEGVTGTVVEDTTMQGVNCQGGSLFAGVYNTSGDQLMMDHDFGACVDDILHGSGTIQNSYAIDNANIPDDHYEPVAYDGGAGAITVNHDTLLNPHYQTAAVFVTCYFGPVTSETIDNSLLAGGDYVLYGPEGNGACDSRTGHQEVKNNRFSRTYFPNGAQYGISAYFQINNTTWSGNIWDDTLAPVPGP